MRQNRTFGWGTHQHTRASICATYNCGRAFSRHHPHMRTSLLPWTSTACAGRPSTASSGTGTNVHAWQWPISSKPKADSFFRTATSCTFRLVSHTPRTAALTGTVPVRGIFSVYSTRSVSFVFCGAAFIFGMRKCLQLPVPLRTYSKQLWHSKASQVCYNAYIICASRSRERK